LASTVDGRANAIIEVGGRLDEMTAQASVSLTPVRIGTAMLGGSNLDVRLVPTQHPLESQGKTRCGRPIPEPFDPVEFAKDPVDGIFQLRGELFAGQVELEDVEVTQQRSRSVRGSINVNQLDLGAISHLSPAFAMSDTPPTGTLTGRIDVHKLALDHPADAEVRVALSQLGVDYGGFHAQLADPATLLRLEGGNLELSGLALAVRSPGGQKVIVDARGTVLGPVHAATADLVVGLRPADLSSLVSDIPGATRVAGTLAGGIHLHGSLLEPKYEGKLELTGGKLTLADFDMPISDAHLTLEVDEEQIRITRGQARLGTGTLELSGGAPIHELELGPARVVVEARNLALSPYPGVRATLDADLAASYRPGPSSSERQRLPTVTGEVRVRSFDYTRPVKMTADLSELAQRGRRTQFEAYDPSEDKVRFDVRLMPRGSMRIQNNLIEAELEIDAAGLQLTGTNQRLGLRGGLKAKTGGRILLRQHEFEIRRGYVHFDDETRILAEVDVTAVTEYKRYSDSTDNDQNGDLGATAASQTSSTGGRWTITMHAYGDADELKIDLTSDPPLAQDDIFLLLTVGLTRAELDQTQSASVSESMALEALGALSGADQAVAEALPMIDDFRFGSQYSSRTGRTEPTVTVGKRLADRIRANVTSGLAESRELRSNIEWRLNQQVSVEGSYDNVNDISSSALGNLGADIRWRLEFE
jgi:translocation and assembly module TamB